ncbi:MAG: protein translocase subunit SecF, partial [Planctomycetaceae bacterium]
ALEVPLVGQPVSEFTVSPLLGIVVQEKGMTAIVVAAVAVFVFMLAYYWVAGAVADLCLLVNLILVLGIMSFIDATFTLPGLAGLVLTIGMAVDANVLIFERIREEQDKGSSLRMSIHNGFSRAFTAIVDSNVTTLITAVVLYMIGTDQVKGFAVTLFIGIVMSMFSALYLGRLVFDILERKRWIKSVKMGTLIGRTNWDFLGKTKLAFATSAVLIVVGIGGFFARGEDNLDIDFLGGSMVTFRFVDTPTVDEVRTALDQQFDTSITLEQLEVVRPDGAKATLFRLRTVEQDPRKLADAINKAFAASGHELVRQHVTAGEIQPLPGPDAAEGAQPPADVDRDPFAGGHEVTLTFSEPINAQTVVDATAESVGKLTADDGASRYEEPESLLRAINAADAGSLTAKGTQFTLKAAPVVSQEDLRAALGLLEADLSDTPNFEEVNTFDTSVATETQVDALMALFFSLLAIVGYLWFRFQRVTFGLACAAAIVHDVLFVVGAVAIGAYLSGNPVGNLFGLEEFKVNMPMIAAFMTIVGYSLNDTIVVFDRVREVRGKNPAMTSEIINTSLNQTLSRTILTSLTTLIVVAILYAIGGEGIHGFAYCLLVGIIVGTYSTIYIAAPVLLWLMNRQPAVRSSSP